MLNRPILTISDDAFADELAAQRMMKEVRDHLDQAIHLMEAINYHSALVQIDTRVFRDAVADELPSDKYWDEKISEARHG